MLLQFVVENHRSFRDRTVLSMLAAPGLEHRPEHVLTAPDGRHILRVAALYGANGSGKSNLVDALATVVDLVVKGTRGDDRLPMVPFKFDAEQAKAPSHFEVELVAAGRHYSYGFEASATHVHAEWLYEVGHDGAESVLFEREASERVPRIELGPALAADAERRGFLSYVAQGTRQNQLFLAEAGERNVTELDAIREVFEDCKCIRPSSRYIRLLDKLEKDDAFRERMGQILNQAGTGIESLRVIKRETDDAPDELREFLQSTPIESTDRTRRFRMGAQGRLETTKLQAMHRFPDGRDIPLDMDQESDGTRRLLHLATMIHYVEEIEGDSLFVVDELERSLHPLLTRMLLQLFLQSGTGATAHQLIFTTHDTNLLDSRLLGHDSIWLVEKDARGGSVIYPLSALDREQVEKLEELGKGLERGYLQGRFGAIPFFGSFAGLNGSGEPAS